MPESPASTPRPFDFADLGRPRPKSVRTLPVAPAADASGQLEELSADDIMESDDIDALEAAAAGYTSFEVDAGAPYVAAAQEQVVVVPAPEPSGFEVGEVGAFDEVQVEGIATRATEPAPEPARIGAVAVIVPAVKAAAPVFESAPITARTPHHASTLHGMPAAPVTSPLPLEDQEESVIISEPAPATPAMVERTLEIRGNDMSKVAAAAAQLTDLADSEPQQTEILVRSAMPPALQQKINARPSSIAPVALDVGQRPPMPAMPPMARVPRAIHMPARGGAVAARPSGGLSGLAVGGMAAAAILLVSLVGIGGYAASRSLSAKTDAVESSAAESAAAANAPSEAPAAAPSDPSGAASSPIDVSSLPSAPVPGATPRGFTGKGSFAVTPPPPAPVAAPVVAASPVVAAPVAAAPAAAAPAAAPVARSSGGALAAPGGGGTRTSSTAGAPLAAPAAAPAVAAAPVAPKPVATTGVVNVDPNLRAVVVDGSFRRATDGVVTVSCGPHKIKAGMKEAQTVNVPCGGAVSL